MATKKKAKQVEASNHTAPARNLLTDAFIVAAVPLAAYMIAFSYEKGFAYFFDIPAELIDISLTRLLIMATGATFVVMWTLLVLSDWHILRRKSQSTLRFHLEQIGLMFCTGIFVVVYFFDSYWVAWLGLIGAMGVFLIRNLIPPLITQRDRKSYEEKYHAHRARREEKSILTRVVIERFGRGAYDLFWLFFFSLGIAWFAGAYKAKSQQEFYVLKSPPELVVLRIYGDILVSAHFDRETREVEQEIIIYKIVKDGPLKILKEKIGPLHLRKEQET